MPITIYITRDFDHMSFVAADIVESAISLRQGEPGEYVLGLPTGNSPTGLYKHLAKAFNTGRIDASRVRSFNLDEYVGLPGENAEQRTMHKESYAYFMISELFSLLRTKFIETNVPSGALVDQVELNKALASQTDDFELVGTGKGQSVEISADATGVLGDIKRTILDAYAAKIRGLGGIDLQIIGVGGRGHVAFHESGIPFDTSDVLLVKLDDNTVANAVADGHFSSFDDSPQFATSMGARLVFEAKSLLLIGNGSRKVGPLTEALLGPVTSDVPLSLAQEYTGQQTWVLDEAAAAGLLEQSEALAARGHVLVDLRGQEYPSVESVTFARSAASGHIE